MGNTGNARTTPTHLHFGIYTNGGAVNPLPFVETPRQIPYKITAPADPINSYVHTIRATAVYASPTRSANKMNLAALSLLHLDAATANWYRVSMPDGARGFISSDNVAAANYKQLALPQGTFIYDKPDTTAPVMLRIPTGGIAQVAGNFNNFSFVHYNNTAGWIKL